jgi:hypothetical protein
VSRFGADETHAHAAECASKSADERVACREVEPALHGETLRTARANARFLVSGRSSADVSSGRVDVNWKAIRSHLSRREWAGAHLLVKVDGVASGSTLAEDVQAAVDKANEVSLRHGDTQQVWADAVLESPRGPIVSVDWVVDGSEMLEWLEALSKALTDSGHRGQITAAPIARIPDGYIELGRMSHVWGFASFRASSRPPRGLWSWRRSRDQAGKQADRMVAWAAFDDAQIYVGASAPVHVTGQEVRGIVRANLIKAHQQDIWWTEDEPIGMSSMRGLLHG